MALASGTRLGAYEILDDIFAVQDDIARAVSTALHVKLLGPLPSASRERGPGYELVLRANHFFQQNTAPALAKAVALYQEAIEKNPNDASAWAGLAKAHALQAGFGYAPAQETQKLARAEAKRAISLDGELAEAHAVMGLLLGFAEFRWDEAISETRRALAISPGASEPMMSMSQYLGIAGRMEDALEMARQAQELDPLNPGTHANRARVAAWALRLEEARDSFLRALELSPSMTAGHGALAIVYLRLGMKEEALAEVQKETSLGYREYYLAVVCHLLGMRQESDAALARLLQLEESWAVQFAGAHAARGERDEAFRWLDRAFELHDSGIGHVPVNWSLKNLHSDPRWPRFLEKIGLSR